MALNPAQGLDNDSALRTDILAESALIQLRQGLKFLPNTTRAFGGVMQGNQYLVPIITGSTANKRAPRDPVVDTVNTSSNIAIPVEEYEYSIVWDPSSYRGQPGKFWTDFVLNGARALTQEIEQAGLATLANNPLITNVVDAGTAITYENIQECDLILNDAGVLEDRRHLVTTHFGKNNILGEAEFAEYNTSGLAGATSDGKPQRNLYGFDPLFTNLVYNGKRATTAALNQGAGLAADVNDTTVPIDTVSVPGDVKVGDVIEIGNERMLVLSISGQTPDADTFVSATLEVKRAVLGTAVAAHADDAAIAIEDGPIALAYQRDDVLHVFTDQEVPAGMRPNMMDKTRASQDGIELYILRETVPGYNGAIRFTMSVVFGLQTVRPAENVVKMVLPVAA